MKRSYKNICWIHIKLTKYQKSCFKPEEIWTGGKDQKKKWRRVSETRNLIKFGLVYGEEICTIKNNSVSPDLKQEIKKLDKEIIELHGELDALKKEKSRIFAALKGKSLRIMHSYS